MRGVLVHFIAIPVRVLFLFGRKQHCLISC